MVFGNNASLRYSDLSPFYLFFPICYCIALRCIGTFVHQLPCDCPVRKTVGWILWKNNLGKEAWGLSSARFPHPGDRAVPWELSQPQRGSATWWWVNEQDISTFICCYCGIFCLVEPGPHGVKRHLRFYDLFHSHTRSSALYHAQRFCHVGWGKCIIKHLAPAFTN